MATERGVILDSSVWVAFLHKEDSQHPKARKMLEGITEPIIVPEYILIEVATILKRKKKDMEAKRFVQTVFNDGGTFLLSEMLAYETAELFWMRRDTLSFIDTALLILSRRYRVITFDAQLARALV